MIDKNVCSVDCNEEKKFLKFLARLTEFGEKDYSWLQLCIFSSEYENG